MSATSNFAYASLAGYAFDWMENPSWNDPVFRSPIPCKAGYNCTYPGVCSFVHPGEEGAGRRIFPARTAEEKDMVRLFHPFKKPEYYRRRELRLSWPEWCARQGLPAPLAPAKTQQTPGGAAPSGKRKQRIVLAENNSNVVKTYTLTMPIYTLPAPQPISLEQLLANYDRPATTSFQTTAEVETVAVSTVESVGTEIFVKVDSIMKDPSSIQALQQFGWYNQSCTAGKIVGMMVDAYNLEELQQILADDEQLYETVVACCEELVADTKRKAEAERLAAATATAHRMRQIGWGDMIAELECAA